MSDKWEFLSYGKSNIKTTCIHTVTVITHPCVAMDSQSVESFGEAKGQDANAVICWFQTALGICDI